jgi:hypothetical protein
MADLIAAAATRLRYAGNTIKKQPDVALGHLLKAQEFTSRAIAPLVEAPEVEEDELDLSPIRAVAYAQLLAASGVEGKANDPLHPETLTYDQGAVLAGSTPDAVRILALLGFFGQVGDNPAVDYSLRERYYDELPVGLDEHGQPTEGNWVPTDPNTDPYTAYYNGQ